MLFKETYYGIFGEENYVSIHLIMEIFIITTAFTIATQAWMIFPHVLSNYRLWLGALFFSIGLLDIFHTISYKGMPFFIADSSPYKATWFYIIGRLTQAIGLLMIILSKDKKIPAKSRLLAYFMASTYSIFWIAVLFYPTQLLPDLVIEGLGTTALKNGLQYFAIIVQAICTIVLLRRVIGDTKDIQSLMLVVASVYLMIGDSMFTTYVSVYDIANFMGHVFQVVGYYFLMRAFYHMSVEEPFERQREAQEQMKHMAFHDHLTKLPNTNFLGEKVKSEISRAPNTKKALLLFDIDRFKKINESLGHTFGDLVIKAVAIRLSEFIPKDYCLSHLGGDKFIVLIPVINNEEEVSSFCQHIQLAMNPPFQIKHLQLNIMLNIGISLYPEHGENRVELLKHAQIAMEESKKEVHRYKFFSTNMDKKRLDRLVLEQDLHKALPNKELYLVYQPQVDLQSGNIFGVEALLRWKHPYRGEVSPGEFIPIAEDTGLIIPIGEWVLREACKQLKLWHDQGKPNISVAVNLSTRQFFQQNLVEVLEEILKDTGLPAHYLELEITESMTMDVEHAVTILRDLKSLGVKIAVDDFGTGYSSLHYLKELPIDRVKIDRSFINNIIGDKRDAALISMIVSIGNHLRFKVIAEGVEHLDQLDYLQEKECWEVQGYIFSRPISADVLTKRFNEMQQRINLLLEQKQRH